MEKISITDFAEQLEKLNARLDAKDNKEIPAAEAQSVTESVTDESEDYRKKLITMMRNTGRAGDFSWTGGSDVELSTQRKQYETIGALTAGSAIPEVWAKDVFRCCPYPASAFWDAPFVKWHDDIKGKLREMFS